MTERETFVAILRALSDSLDIIAAPMELRAAINSFDDTIDDEEVLDLIKYWNLRARYE